MNITKSRLVQELALLVHAWGEDLSFRIILVWRKLAGFQKIIVLGEGSTLQYNRDFQLGNK